MHRSVCRGSEPGSGSAGDYRTALRSGGLSGRGGHASGVPPTGTPPVTYQWSINGVTLEGETAPDLNLASLTPQDQGDYAVVVADGTGSVSPPPVRLMVIPHDLVAGRGWEIRLGTPEMVPWETSNEDGNPSVASDGLTLTFSSRRAGGRGGWDLWTASRPSRSSTWGRPVNLGPSGRAVPG